MARPPQFDSRMSEAENMMWRLEKDPYLSSTVANITVLDTAVDFDRFRYRLDRASRLVPRLRQRVQPTPVSLTPPLWVDDPEFDLDYHVRHVALPEPGSLRQLCNLATLIAADPFDRTRPLWAFYVVDGLEGGQGAIIQKLHHTVADGEGSLRLSMQFIDLTRDAEDPPMPPEPEPGGAEAPPPPSAVETVRDVVTGGLRMPIGISRQYRELLADPTQIPTAGFTLARTVKGVISQLSDVEAAHSPVWTRRSLKRRLETLRSPLDETKAAAKKLGGTLNTAFICAAAAAAGEYHRAVGAPVEQLRASMAISTRTRESGSNAFSLARLLVPTGEMDMAERFRLIHEATTTAREASATAGLETIAAVAATLPTSLVTRLAKSQAQTVDFATSNVRAADFPCYIAGALILANYAIGPLAGVAFNLTLLSYNGSLDMGMNVDTAAVEDPELLRTCMESAFAELGQLGRPARRAAAVSSRPAGARRRAASARRGGGPPPRRSTRAHD
ncbi:MAG TPA: wax ester/triacylglycerol synthase domain-containing protein [Acidimicrobiales bacterium]